MGLKKTIEQVDVAGRRVLMRVDFNVPLNDRGGIADDRRIVQSLPSIRSVIDRGGRLVLMSHLGRPKGSPDPAMSLKPAAERLGELLQGAKVTLAPDCIGEATSRAVNELRDGDVIVLENLRFHSGETQNDESFSSELASLGDVYCNNAFGTAHREHASMMGVPRAMEGKPRVVGLLVRDELKYLSGVLASPERPFVAILGGAKVSSKLGAIRNLLGTVDTLLIGGAMSYTLLKAQGRSVGASLVEDEMLDEAKAICEDAKQGKTSLMLPSDHVCARSAAEGGAIEVHSGDIPDGWMGLDIGPETVGAYERVLAEARTIIWNGPVGLFETPPFDAGTRRLATKVAQATDGGAISVIGGGDTAAAVEQFGMAERFSHVSTGGGASLKMLEGAPFPTIDLLDDA